MRTIHRSMLVAGLCLLACSTGCNSNPGVSSSSGSSSSGSTPPPATSIKTDVGAFTQVTCNATAKTTQCWTCEVQAGDLCVLSVAGLQKLEAAGPDYPIQIRRNWKVLWVSNQKKGKLKMQKFKHVDCDNPANDAPNALPWNKKINRQPFISDFASGEKFVSARLSDDIQADGANLQCYKHNIKGDGTVEHDIDPHVFIDAEEILKAP